MIKSWEVLRVMGPRWLASRGMYALRLRCGLVEGRTPANPWNDSSKIDFSKHYIPRPEGTNSAKAIEVADRLLMGYHPYFFRHEIQGCFPPRWFGNPFYPEVLKDLRHWSRISDFGCGDIKGVWEANRFMLAHHLARAYLVSRSEKYADAFWIAVEDWRRENPPQLGPNWKCGQEIAIRLIAWLYAMHVFQPSCHSTERRRLMLAEMVHVSAERIAANIDYALNQQNNHGISEAAGLFTAGIAMGNQSWIDQGKQLLERQARELIYDDGSFSQHSVNYHRVMLQTYLWAIHLARHNHLEFAPEMIDRVRAAARWLFALIDPASGRCPNFGPNDGALVLPLSDADYLDYRPTVQAASVILDGAGWLPPGPWDDLAQNLGYGNFSYERPAHATLQGGSGGRKEFSTEGAVASWFPDGGYGLLRRENGFALLHCPSYLRHRPHHCDLLHVDLWHRGVNVLRDGGTFSYNCEPSLQNYFSSTSAHNTVQFDSQEQMPKLSRFLFGRWPKITVTTDFGSASPMFSAKCQDWCGCIHERQLAWTDTGFRIIDRLEGYRKQAVLRWRLAPEWKWQMEGNRCYSDGAEISIQAKSPSLELRIVSGWESLYYHERTPLEVLEGITHDSPQTLVTDIHLM